VERGYGKAANKKEDVPSGLRLNRHRLFRRVEGSTIGEMGDGVFVTGWGFLTRGQKVATGVRG